MTTKPSLKLERKDAPEDDGVIAPGISITPSIDEDYWEYRVIVGEHQAVVGFPKFSTIGIGFAVEDEDWNVNLPYSIETNDIWNHIKKNKGDDSIPDEWCIEAIKLIQTAARKDRGDTRPPRRSATAARKERQR